MTGKEVLRTVLWTMLSTVFGLLLLGGGFLAALHFHPDYNISQGLALLRGESLSPPASKLPPGTVSDIPGNRRLPHQTDISRSAAEARNRKRLTTIRDSLQTALQAWNEAKDSRQTFSQWSGKADEAGAAVQDAEERLDIHLAKVEELSRRMRTKRIALANAALMTDRQKIAAQARQSATSSNIRALMAIADNFNNDPNSAEARKAREEAAKARREAAAWKRAAEQEVRNANPDRRSAARLRADLASLEVDYLELLQQEPDLKRALRDAKALHREQVGNARHFSERYEDTLSGIEELRWAGLTRGYLLESDQDLDHLEQILALDKNSTQ